MLQLVTESKDKIIQLQMEKHEVTVLNNTVTKELEKVQNEFNELKQDVKELEQFIPEYKLLQKKFPDYNAAKIVEYFEKISDLGLEQ